ncbi:MAG TPA: hypothetical protein VNN73_22150 [Blastocatellia bacterium]|nr:hypothetical protein [Blastocatellia bacterium]
MNMPERFSIDMFSDCVNTKFVVHYGDSQTANLELVSVTDVGSSARQVQFSLVFVGRINGAIEQRIYRLEHEKLGQLDLFLVPIGMDKNGVQYEAICNYVIE